MGLVCCQVDDSGVAIFTTAVWGALHALRSLGMLLQASRDGDSSMDCMYIDGNGQAIALFGVCFVLDWPSC